MTSSDPNRVQIASQTPFHSPVQSPVQSPVHSPDASQGSPDGSSLGRFWLSAVLVFAGIVVYSNSLNGPFIFDDEKNILDRELVHSLDSLGPLLVSTKRPSLMFSLALNYAIAGQNVQSYHLFNLAGHLGAALVLFGLVRRTLLLPATRTSFQRSADWLAFSTALIWLVHPLQTQSVTYIIQRSESMMGLFYLLSLYCLVRGASSIKPYAGHIWYIAGILSVAISFGFKGAAVSAPLVLLCYDRVFLADRWNIIIRRRGWFHLGVLFVACGFVYRMANIFTDSVRSGVGIGCGVSSWEYLRSEAGVIIHYLGLALWPRHLCLDYGWPIAHDATAIYGSGTVILILVSVSFLALRYCSRIGFVGVTFFLLLAPTSSFIPVVDLAFEHRMYLPLVCLSMLATFAAFEAMGRVTTNEKARRRAFLVGIGCAAICLGTRAHLRNRDYQSAVSIWTSVVECAPHNARGWYNLGLAQGDAGNLSSATESYRRALMVDSTYALAHYNLARILSEQVAEKGHRDTAIAHYRKALKEKPDYADASYNLARLLTKNGQLQQSIKQYQRTLEIDPAYRDASYNLAGVYTKTEQFEKAIKQYRHTLVIDPNDASAKLNLASVLYRLGRTEEAIAQYRQTLHSDPTHHRARLLLATILAEAGREEEAEQCYEEPIQRDRRNCDLLDQYGLFLARRGKFQRATERFRQCLAASPDHAAAQAHLGMALHELGQDDEAVRRLRSALKQQPGLVNAAALLARILATSGDSRIRNGKEAVRMAERLNRETRGLNLDVLEVLAAAYAEVGDFASAIQTVSQAQEHALARGKNSAADRFGRHKAMYETRNRRRKTEFVPRADAGPSKRPRSKAVALACPVKRG